VSRELPKAENWPGCDSSH